MARILKGSAVAETIRAEALETAAPLMERGITPRLCLIRANDDEAAISYERSLISSASRLGFDAIPVTLSPKADERDIIQAVQDANMDNGIDGIMVLAPLPRHVDANAVMDAIYPAKDVDGASMSSLMGVFTGKRMGFAPATAEAVIRILDYYGIGIEGRSAAVIGRSLIVGKPAAMLLLERNATVTLCHSRTPDLGSAIAGSDIVVVAAGVPRFIDASHLQGCKDAVVIDVGVNTDEDGALCGDVDFESASSAVAAVTPVPGGVGTVVTSLLLLHCATAAKSRRG